MGSGEWSGAARLSGEWGVERPSGSVDRRYAHQRESKTGAVSPLTFPLRAEGPIHFPFPISHFPLPTSRFPV